MRHEAIGENFAGRVGNRCRCGLRSGHRHTLLMFSTFGIEAALGEHLAISSAFVGVSLIHGFLLRRLFEAVQLRSKALALRIRAKTKRRTGLVFAT